MRTKNQQTQLPDCARCKHFYITYDSRHPRGCRAYGFKSKQPPATLVYAGSGLRCQFFCQKETGKRK